MGSNALALFFEFSYSSSPVANIRSICFVLFGSLCCLGHRSLRPLSYNFDKRYVMYTAIVFRFCLKQNMSYNHSPADIAIQSLVVIKQLCFVLLLLQRDVLSYNDLAYSNSAYVESACTDFVYSDLALSKQSK